MILHSEDKAVSVTLDGVFVVPRCRRDLFSLKAWDSSGKTFSGGDGKISLLHRNLELLICRNLTGR